MPEYFKDLPPKEQQEFIEQVVTDLENELSSESQQDGSYIIPIIIGLGIVLLLTFGDINPAFKQVIIISGVLFLVLGIIRFFQMQINKEIEEIYTEKLDKIRKTYRGKPTKNEQTKEIKVH